jgi:hypothetical protein
LQGGRTVDAKLGRTGGGDESEGRGGLTRSPIQMKFAVGCQKRAARLQVAVEDGGRADLPAALARGRAARRPRWRRGSRRRPAAKGGAQQDPLPRTIVDGSRGSFNDRGQSGLTTTNVCHPEGVAWLSVVCSCRPSDCASPRCPPAVPPPLERRSDPDRPSVRDENGLPGARTRATGTAKKKSREVVGRAVMQAAVLSL